MAVVIDYLMHEAVKKSSILSSLFNLLYYITDFLLGWLQSPIRRNEREKYPSTFLYQWHFVAKIAE